MTPDQIMAALAMLMAEPDPHFDGMRGGGYDARYPVTVSACDTALGPLEVEEKTVICGAVNVPENYTAPGGRRIDLKFAVLRAKSQSPAPDPLVYLHGGPAAGTLDKLEPVATLLFPNHRRTRDIVTFDQRAAARSATSMQCYDNIADHIIDLVPVEIGLQATPQVDKVIAPCIAEIKATGADLSAYNTENNARDVRALTSALGYPEYNLYGISYGTRLALEVLRTQPQGVRSAVIDGIAPSTVRIYDELMTPYADALDTLIAQCKADDNCNAAYPDLDATINAAFERVGTTPIEASRGMPEINTDFLFALTFDMRNNWHDSKTITPSLPLIFTELAEGQTDAIDALIAQGDLAQAGIEPWSSGLTPQDTAFIEAALSVADAMRELDSVAVNAIARLREDLVKDDAALNIAQAFEALSNEAALRITGRSKRLAMVRDYALLQREAPSRATLVDWVESHFHGTDRGALLDLIEAMSGSEVVHTFGIADQQATIYEQIFGSVFNIDTYACQEDIPWNSREGFDARLAEISERYPFLDDPEIRAYIGGFFEQCDLFEQYPRKNFQTPVVSDIPVLALNGTLDIQTSVHWGGIATKPLTNARNIIVPEAGHGTIAYQPCANDISVAFVSDPEAVLDTGCLDGLAPSFLVPTE